MRGDRAGRCGYPRGVPLHRLLPCCLGLIVGCGLDPVTALTPGTTGTESDGNASSTGDDDDDDDVVGTTSTGAASGDDDDDNGTTRGASGTTATTDGGAADTDTSETTTGPGVATGSGSSGAATSTGAAAASSTGEPGTTDTGGTTTGSDTEAGSTAVETGPCCEDHGGLGCEDVGTAQCVCALDPFCCEVSWDRVCIDLSISNCDNECELVKMTGGTGETGPDIPPGGNCCFAHGGIGCEVPEVQACVCAADGFCCSISWDGLCAGAAPACGADCS